MKKRCGVANGVVLATGELEQEEKCEALNGVELAACDLEHKAQTDRGKKARPLTASSTPCSSSSTEHRQS